MAYDLGCFGSKYRKYTNMENSARWYHVCLVRYILSYFFTLCEHDWFISIGNQWIFPWLGKSKRLNNKSQCDFLVFSLTILYLTKNQMLVSICLLPLDPHTTGKKDQNPASILEEIYNDTKVVHFNNRKDLSLCAYNVQCRQKTVL